MQAQVNLPDELESNIRNDILTMARSAFETVKQEATYPRYMRIEQASQFMNCSRSTLTNKCIPAGLKVILIDGLQYVDQKDAVSFMEQHKK